MASRGVFFDIGKYPAIACAFARMALLLAAPAGLAGCVADASDWNEAQYERFHANFAAARDADEFAHATHESGAAVLAARLRQSPGAQRTALLEPQSTTERRYDAPAGWYAAHVLAAGDSSLALAVSNARGAVFCVSGFRGEGTCRFRLAERERIDLRAINRGDAPVEVWMGLEALRIDAGQIGEVR